MLNRKESNQIRDILKSKNIKVTLPRIYIYKILKDVSTELTAYDVEDMSIRYNNRINLATIYGTLKIFQNMGLVQRFKRDSAQALYTLANSDGIFQIYCQNCGALQDVDYQNMQQQIQQFCSQENMTLQSCTVMLNILSCKHCGKSH